MVRTIRWKGALTGGGAKVIRRGIARLLFSHANRMHSLMLNNRVPSLIDLGLFHFAKGKQLDHHIKLQLKEDGLNAAHFQTTKSLQLGMKRKAFSTFSLSFTLIFDLTEKCFAHLHVRRDDQRQSALHSYDIWMPSKTPYGRMKAKIIEMSIIKNWKPHILILEIKGHMSNIQNQIDGTNNKTSPKHWSFVN